MSEVGWCNQCGEPYRESWCDPGICAPCAWDNLTSAVFDQLEPVVRWLNRKLTSD